MIKIYDKNNNFIRQMDKYKNLHIEKGVNQLDLLFFNVPKQFGDLFEEEGYIETKGYGRFVIKEKNLGSEDYQIVSKYDLEELNIWVDTIAYVTETPKEILDDLLENTDWEVISTISIKRTITGTNLTILAFIKEIISTFNAEVAFDNLNKKIYIENELGTDKGTYFTDQLNLRQINISSDSHDFATRLIPIGFNEMGIELINDEIPYVENYSYSNKIITVYWQDERYTDIENLKFDAIKKLEEISKPRRSFSCDVVNLSKASENYSILDYEIGDTITLISKDTNTKEKQRIVKLKHYPDNPLLDTVEIENRPRIFGASDRENIDNLRTSFNVTRASLELFEDGILGRVTDIEGSIEQIGDEFTEVDARIIDNTAELEILSTEISTKVSQTEYDGDYKEVKDNYTEFKQEFDNFTSQIQIGGGSNLIKNSVGYGNLNYWELIDGEIESTNNKTWILEGVSKYGWIISDGEMAQIIDIMPNKEYTLSGKYRKQTPAGSIFIGLYDIETEELLEEIVNDTEEFDGEFTHNFTLGDIRQIVLRVKVEGASEIDPIMITDLMLARGENYNYWSQAMGETYTLYVKVDGEGIEVTSSDGKGKTIMSPEEFAGYYNNRKIFTLNGEITEVMGLLIKEKGLYIPPVKFVQTSESLDVVWTGVM